MVIKLYFKFIEMLQQLLQNKHLMCAFGAMLVAQLLKLIFEYRKNKKLNFRILTQSGGMPSSHTAMVSALATAVGLYDGFTSVSYAIAVIFALIVMYDSAGVRQAAGKQARILNQIMNDLGEKKLKGDKLRELIGHTPLEVIAGGFLGIIYAFIGYLVL